LNDQRLPTSRINKPKSPGSTNDQRFPSLVIRPEWQSSGSRSFASAPAIEAPQFLRGNVRFELTFQASGHFGDNLNTRRTNLPSRQTSTCSEYLKHLIESALGRKRCACTCTIVRFGQQRSRREPRYVRQRSSRQPPSTTAPFIMFELEKNKALPRFWRPIPLKPAPNLRTGHSGGQFPLGQNVIGKDSDRN
jgi:hypothetical protein